MPSRATGRTDVPAAVPPPAEASPAIDASSEFSPAVAFEEFEAVFRRD